MENRNTLYTTLVWKYIIKKTTRIDRREHPMTLFQDYELWVINRLEYYINILISVLKMTTRSLIRVIPNLTNLTHPILYQYFDIST